VHDFFVFFAGALQYSTLFWSGEADPALLDPARPKFVGELMLPFRYSMCHLQ